MVFRRVTQKQILWISFRWEQNSSQSQKDGQENMVKLKVAYRNLANAVTIKEYLSCQGVGDCFPCIFRLTSNLKPRRCRR